jgi:hypothetical protein
MMAADQLHIKQRPCVQEHTGMGAPTRVGRQRRTQAIAPGSVRSVEPPGQQKRCIRATKWLVSDAERPATAEMWWRGSSVMGTNACTHPGYRP